MSKVPTINPGPDDSDRMPQDATETLPIISAADTKQPQTSLDDSTDISPMKKPMQSSRQSVPSVGAKSSSDAVSPSVSLLPSRSLPSSQRWSSTRNPQAPTDR